jgi:enoyl-CoA hydratase/carnithine racemase
VTRAVPAAELDEVAETMIARLASRNARALAGAKEMIAAVRDVPVADGVAAERRIFLDHMGKNEDVRATLGRFLQPKPAP